MVGLLLVGLSLVFLFWDANPSLGQCVVSLFGGSGSMFEACMHTGRSCVMFEINGCFSLLQLLLDRQYEGARARMKEIFSKIDDIDDIQRYQVGLFYPTC